MTKDSVLIVYLSIYGIYIAPLQGNYLEALPAQARATNKEGLFVIIMGNFYFRYRRNHYNGFEMLN